jgi:hypothetical protein
VPSNFDLWAFFCCLKQAILQFSPIPIVKKPHIKILKSMLKSIIFLSIISFLILSQSCTRQKGYFQQNVAQNYHKVDSQKEILPIETSSIPSTIENEPILTSSISENFTEINKVSDEIKYQERIVKIEKFFVENKAVSKPQKLNFVQKIILKKVQKKMANTTKPVGFHDWNPFLKIGVILLGIGIILAIFGLGAIGGISAFIGLIFTILGLLSSV